MSQSNNSFDILKLFCSISIMNPYPFPSKVNFQNDLENNIQANSQERLEQIKNNETSDLLMKYPEYSIPSFEKNLNILDFQSHLFPKIHYPYSCNDFAQYKMFIESNISLQTISPPSAENIKKVD